MNVLMLPSFNGTHRSELNRFLIEILQSKLDIPSNKFRLPLLSGHSYDNDLDVNDISALKIWNKARIDILDFIDFSQDQYLAGTSTGAYAILDFVSRNPDKTKHLKGIFLIKPMVDLEYSIQESNKLVDFDLEDILDVLGLKQIIGNLYGVENNPHKTYQVPIHILYGSNDNVVGDYQFVKSRVSGENISFYEIPNSTHFQLRRNESQDIEEIFGKIKIKEFA